MPRKPIIIQGTNVALNTPEDIEAWIAERKKRFPTANRVADKKTKLEEAAARGQLPFDDNPRFAKRPRLEEPNHGANRGRASGRGRWKRNGPPGGFDGAVNRIKTAPESLSPQTSLPTKPSVSVAPGDRDPSDSDDGPPEALSTKNTVPEPLVPPVTSENSENVEVNQFLSEKPTGQGRHAKRQPRGPPPIPFGQNASLLRNVRSSARQAHVDGD